MADFTDGNRAFSAFKDVLTTQVKNGKMLDGQMNPEPKFWIEVTKGGAGYFAVMLWDGDGYPEPWDSGEGRYSEPEPAGAEAKRWALEEGIEFRA
jgi:hypothetical protein